MSQPIVLSSFGGDATVGSIATDYPLTPGVDVNFQSAAQTGALAASAGLTAGELVKAGTFSVAGTAAGTIDEAIAFATAFPTATDAVLLTFTSLGGAVINGGAYAASVAASGFNATVDITTAGTADVTGYYVAFGH